MGKPKESRVKNQVVTISVLWALIALYAAARVLQIFQGKVPMLAVVALHVLPPAVFAMIHGAMLYRSRGVLSFIALCLIVGNVFENLGVLTGFPYGHYYFTDLMGPKLFNVPIFLELAYVGMAYLSWILALAIVGRGRITLTGASRVTVPLLAAFMMVAWDLAMDPIWGTVLHAWIWLEGGAYFGVPVSNFFGWYLTVYVIYQLFAIYIRQRETGLAPLPLVFWHLAVILYGLSAAGNLLLAIPQKGPPVVSDAMGVRWQLSHIVYASIVVSVLAMGTCALLAWARLANPRNDEQNPSCAAGIPGDDLVQLFHG